MTIDESPAATIPTAEPAQEIQPEPPRPARARRGGGQEDNGERTEGKRTFFILLGAALFFAVYFAPIPGPAIDPEGQSFALTPEGKAALALFFLAATWWVTEVVPIGVTSIAIGVMQGLFLIRPAEDAFSNFMVPSVWFIFGSLIIGKVFTKTGLTRRLAYRMLSLVGERTSMIYLGCFVLTSAMTLFMAHTAVAATIYPLLLAVYALYTDETEPTKFGKGLFIGVATRGIEHERKRLPGPFSNLTAELQIGLRCSRTV